MKLKSINPWRKPTYEQKVQLDLEAAKLSLLEARKRLDWEHCIVEYYARMVERLEKTQ